MLNITPQGVPAHAKSYYRHNSRQDYYAADTQELTGHWGGTTAKRLGLNGPIEAIHFDRLCDNLHPLTGESLTARTKAGRTVGTDFTFNPPKSVSLVHALGGDDRILAEFRAAVNDTMLEIEAHAQTRVRRQRADFNRTTGNLLWAEFVHFTSRPVDRVPDPHLHSHIFVFNATYDADEDAMKAVQFRPLHEDGPYFQAFFYTRLATRLQELGYGIRKTAVAFEIEGIDDALIRAFSRRTAQIEAIARAKGIDDNDEKAKLAQLHRENKRLDLTGEELRANWLGRLSEREKHELLAIVNASRQRTLGLKVDSEESPSLPPPEPSVPKLSSRLPPITVRPAKTDDGPPTEAERRAVELAILHVFERQSVVSENRLIGEALQFGIGHVRIPAIRQLVARDPDLIRGVRDDARLVTTTAVLAEERWLVAWTRSGRGALRPINPSHRIGNLALGPAQIGGVRLILTSPDRVIALQGKSGVGKSTLLMEAITGIHAAGLSTVVMAPTSSASRGSLRRSGIADAETIDRFLARAASRGVARGGIWIVDEAGMVSVPQLTRIARFAEQHGARLVLSGDTGQHRSIERGDALRTLYQHAELPMVEVDTVRRQRGIYRQAVEAFAAGDTLACFQYLDQLQAIREAPPESRHRDLTADYVATLAEGRSALVIAPTHLECQRVTQTIREELRALGLIRDVRPIPTLARVDTTEAQRVNPRIYEPGLVLQWSRPAPGIVSGDTTEVLRVNAHAVTVRTRDGLERHLDIERYARRFEVFEPRLTPVGIGDRVRITRNGRCPDGTHIDNGDIFTVEGFGPGGELHLDHGRTLPASYRHLTHGHVQTSYTAQSKTVDRVLIAIGPESLIASNRESFYVALSRGSEWPRIYTGSREELFDAIQTTSQRPAALDLVDRPRTATVDTAEPAPSLRGHLGQHQHVAALAPPPSVPIEPPIQEPPRQRMVIGL